MVVRTCLFDRNDLNPFITSSDRAFLITKNHFCFFSHFLQGLRTDQWMNNSSNIHVNCPSCQALLEIPSHVRNFQVGIGLLFCNA